MKNKYKITIAYDGTNYSGWQIQPNAISIQETIQKALELILQEKISIIASGRTDAGVHALAQVAHFSTDKAFDTNQLLYSLNGILPKDIRIKKIEKTPSSFHARYSATGKTYRYYLSLGSYQDPFDRKHSTHFPQKLDLDLLRKATTYFLGTHDFTSFANKGRASFNPIKHLRRLEVTELDKKKLCFTFEADGFLYKMIRNIMGTLLAVSTKKIPLEDLPKIFKAKNRKEAGKSAPAKGLFLVGVNYKSADLEISSKDSK